MRNLALAAEDSRFLFQSCLRIKMTIGLQVIAWWPCLLVLHITHSVIPGFSHAETEFGEWCAVPWWIREARCIF